MEALHIAAISALAAGMLGALGRLTRLATSVVAGGPDPDLKPGPRLAGEREGVPVHVLSTLPDMPPAVVFVDAPAARVEVGRRGVLDRRGVSGDPGFDERVRVGGPELELRALLDAPTRVSLLRLIESDGEVRDGRVAAPWHYGEPFGLTHPRVGLLVEVARRLGASGDPLDRVMKNALEDPRAGVQEGCLRLLLRVHPARGAAVAEQLAVRARGGPRLVALRALRRPELWLALARDGGEPVAARAEALAHVEGVAEAELDGAVADALRGPEDLQEAALQLLLGEAGRRWRATLASMAHATWVERDDRCERWRQPRLGSALARAFAAWARTQDEDVLVTMVFADGAIARHAGEALARVGSGRVLSRLPERGELTRVREAILARHTGPTAGGLSLADGHGQLGEPDPRAGGLRTVDR